MTTHTDAHVESQGLSSMTSPLKQPAAEDGLSRTKQVVAGALYALVCVCVCVCGGDVMSAGAGLAPP